MDNVTSRRLVAPRVNQMPGTKAKDRAVSEKLIQVGVWVAGWLLGLVLGVDDGGGLRQDHCGRLKFPNVPAGRPSLIGQAPGVAAELLAQAVEGVPSGSFRHVWLASRLADALYRTGDRTDAEEGQAGSATR